MKRTTTALMVSAVFGGFVACLSGQAMAAAAAGPAPAEVSAHQLMTVQERMALREQMRAAQSPAERHDIMVAKVNELRARATERGAVLLEPGAMHPHGGGGGMMAEGRGRGGPADGAAGHHAMMHMQPPAH